MGSVPYTAERRELSRGKPITADELWLITPAAEARGMLDEATRAVESGWPAVCVVKAIECSEAHDAEGIDYWLDVHGYVSWWGRREEEPEAVSEEQLAEAWAVIRSLLAIDL